MGNTIALIGCHGFVGSAISRFLKNNDVVFYEVNRSSFNELRGNKYDIIMNARRRRGRTASAPRRTSGCGLISDPIPAHERYE